MKSTLTWKVKGPGPGSDPDSGSRFFSVTSTASLGGVFGKDSPSPPNLRDETSSSSNVSTWDVSLTGSSEFKVVVA